MQGANKDRRGSCIVAGRNSASLHTRVKYRDSMNHSPTNCTRASCPSGQRKICNRPIQQISMKTRRSRTRARTCSKIALPSQTPPKSYESVQTAEIMRITFNRTFDDLPFLFPISMDVLKNAFRLSTQMPVDSNVNKRKIIF